MTSIEVRVLNPVGIEDYHAHLLRLDVADRKLRFAEECDDRGIDGHCLRLLGAQAIVIGGYADGVLRTGFEICLDRTARRGEAIFTSEPKYSLGGAIHMLVARMIDEARRYHLAELTLSGFDKIAELERALPGNVEIVRGENPVLRFENAALPLASGASLAPSMAASYA